MLPKTDIKQLKNKIKKVNISSTRFSSKKGGIVGRGNVANKFKKSLMSSSSSHTPIISLKKRNGSTYIKKIALI